MSHCPSHDWDRHIDELDREAEAECQFYRQYQSEILQVVCALIARGTEIDAEKLVSTAANIVLTLTNRKSVEF